MSVSLTRAVLLANTRYGARLSYAQARNAALEGRIPATLTDAGRWIVEESDMQEMLRALSGSKMPVAA